MAPGLGPSKRAPATNTLFRCSTRKRTIFAAPHQATPEQQWTTNIGLGKLTRPVCRLSFSLYLFLCLLLGLLSAQLCCLQAVLPRHVKRLGHKLGTARTFPADQHLWIPSQPLVSFLICLFLLLLFEFLCSFCCVVVFLQCVRRWNPKQAALFQSGCASAVQQRTIQRSQQPGQLLTSALVLRFMGFMHVFVAVVFCESESRRHRWLPC